MRSSLVVIACGCWWGCGRPNVGTGMEDAPPMAMSDAATAVDGDVAGFGVLSGMCGVLAELELTEATPELFRDTMTFPRAFHDPVDRWLLTVGGRRLLEVPNAGGSSALSEAFAFEELARCEHAELLHTETEIMYTTTGKITDLEVAIGGHKIGVSVTRAFAFPLGQPYTLAAATTLITRKLQDITVSSANVAPVDRWDKQILAVLAFDDQAADVVGEVWTSLAPAIKADTIVVVTVTGGSDTFIYTNQ